MYKKSPQVEAMLKEAFGGRSVEVAPESMSDRIKKFGSNRTRIPIGELKGMLEQIAENVDKLHSSGSEFSRGFEVLCKALDLMHKESSDKHLSTEEKHAELKKQLAKAIALESKTHIDKAKSLEKELGKVRKSVEMMTKNMSGINEKTKAEFREMQKLMKTLRKQLREAGSDDNGSSIMILQNDTIKSPSAFGLNFKDSATVTLNVVDNPQTGNLEISFTAAASGSSIATEKLTGTQSGSNVTLNLTQLAHTFVAIQLVTRNGQILTPVTSWSRVSNTITISNADASEDFLVQYTY